uniref:p325-like protein n=1 Tax=Glyptapanteles flavicoxis TaxID=463051 RepID=B7S871_9HYME|nr:P325-like protein [Glyptapanteles flavicoxis]
MLCRTILTLLIASIVISRIEAREIGERRAQLDKTPVDGVNTVVEAVAVQNDNTFNTGLNDESIYGSVVKVKNTIYESPDSRQPISTQTHTVVAPGGPGYDGISYAKSEERDQQGQPINKVSATTYMSGNSFDVMPESKHVFGSYIEQNNNVYRSRDGNNQSQPNEKHKSPNRGNGGLTAETILTNNAFYSNGNSHINAGVSITGNGHVYAPDMDSESGKETINGTERPDESFDTLKEFVENMKDVHNKINEWNNRLFSGNQSDTQQDPTGSEPDSIFIFDNYNLNSQTEKNAEDTKEKEAYAEKHKRPNGQPSLSPTVYYLFTYFLIMLIKLSVLN